jgi:uncharacterized protein with GYD domain
MATYVLLTRIIPQGFRGPQSLESLEKQVAEKIRHDLPDVRWVKNYAVLGPYDYLDIFEAPDNDTAGRVSLIVRSFGHAFTEVWPVTPWQHFEDLIETTE